MSRSRLVAYWVTTGLVASSMVSGGVAQVLHVPANVEGFVRLGYPLHFVTLSEQDALAEGGYVFGRPTAGSGGRGCLELLGQPVSIHPVTFSTRVLSLD